MRRWLLGIKHSSLWFCSNSPQTLFSPDNFIHHMTEALELMMNEVNSQQRSSGQVICGRAVHSRLVTVLVLDSQDHRERGADSSHEASQRSWETNSGLSASKVTSSFSSYVFILCVNMCRSLMRWWSNSLINWSSAHRRFCSCLVQPAEDSPELTELVEINYEFQVCVCSVTCARLD